MASENVSSVSNTDDDEYGFKRPDMYQSNLAGTVAAHHRHIYLCYKNPEAWASRVEDNHTDLLPKLLSSAVKARKNDITLKTNVTICEGREGTEFLDGDVLIFPDMIKYRGLKDTKDSSSEDARLVDTFVEDVLVNGKPWASGVPEVLTGSHVFVCAHGSRDKRCGVCGPPLIEKLKEEIELRGLKDQVFVSPCSHIGGHKYAGNLIIYSPGLNGKIMGHWYGYVTPEDVSELLDKHVAKGEIIQWLWRGQMGVDPEEDKKSKEPKLPKGEEKSKNEPLEINNQVNKENVTSCCQGANGFTCCREASSENTNGIEETKPAPAETHGRLGNLSCWKGTWDKSDILTAVAVAGPATTIAVASSFYRRSLCNPCVSVCF